MAKFQANSLVDNCFIICKRYTRDANYWTAPGARYHGEINSPCTNSINRISTKIALSVRIQFPRRNGMVCIYL